MRSYEFGTIILNESLPCYKIEKSGKITVYMNMMEMGTKKEVTYESKLSLSKVRNMSEV
jgi:hypothetical protein